MMLAISLLINLLEMISSLFSINLILTKMDLLLSNNMLISLESILEMELILLPNHHQSKLLLVFLKRNMHLFMLFGINLKSISINMTEERKVSLMMLNLKDLLLKYLTKLLKKSLTTFSGTCSELIQT